MRQGNCSSQAVGGIHSQSGPLSFCPLFLFLPCFDTLIFTICPVRPITSAFHFYASAVWANDACSCCRQTALSPCALGLHVQPNRPVSETRNPRAESTTSINISLQSTILNGSDLHFISSDIPFVAECALMWLNKTDRCNYVKGKYPIICSGAHPWLNIIFLEMQLWRVCGNLYADSGQHQDSCTDSRKRSSMSVAQFNSLFLDEIHERKETLLCRVNF